MVLMLMLMVLTVTKFFVDPVQNNLPVILSTRRCSKYTFASSSYADKVKVEHSKALDVRLICQTGIKFDCFERIN